MTFEMVALADGQTLSLSLYPGAFALKVGECEVYSLDGEGRLVGAFTGDRWLRRGLDNTVIEKRANALTIGWRPLPALATAAVLDSTARRFEELTRAVREGRFASVGPDAWAPAPDAVAPWLERAARWDSQRNRCDAEQFLRIYRKVTILPPDQYLSLVLQPTEGCCYNRCIFCDFYRDRPFRVKPLEEFGQHVDEVKAFFGRGLARRRSLFLGDANALAIPMEALVPVFRTVQERFPIAPSALTAAEARRWLSGRPLGFDGVYSFLDVFSGRKKSAADYALLGELGLRRVYIGLESGHFPLLRFLRKPERVEDAVEVVHTLHEAGVAVGVIVMVGAGGDRYADGHVQDTVTALNAMRLGGDDFLYLSQFVEHGDSEYALLARAAAIRPLDAGQLAAQERALRSGFRFPGASPRISVYRIGEFLY